MQAQSRTEITQIGVRRDRIGGDVERRRATEAGAEGVGMGSGGCVGAHQGDGIGRCQLGGIENSAVDGGHVEAEGRINTGKILGVVRRSINGGTCIQIHPGGRGDNSSNHLIGCAINRLGVGDGDDAG